MVVMVVLGDNRGVYDGVRNMSLIIQEKTVVLVVRLSPMTRTRSIRRPKFGVASVFLDERLESKARCQRKACIRQLGGHLVTQGKHDSSLPNVTPSANNSP